MTSGALDRGIGGGGGRGGIAMQGIQSKARRESTVAAAPSKSFRMLSSQSDRADGLLFFFSAEKYWRSIMVFSYCFLYMWEGVEGRNIVALRGERVSLCDGDLDRLVCLCRFHAALPVGVRQTLPGEGH